MFYFHLSDANTDYSNDQYVKDNMAILHVYFEELNFLRRERTELYGILDFFSNIGGLLGLCMGFSALSAAEAIYFFTLRLFLNIRLPRSENV